MGQLLRQERLIGLSQCINLGLYTSHNSEQLNIFHTDRIPFPAFGRQL